MTLPLSRRYTWLTRLRVLRRSRAMEGWLYIAPALIFLALVVVLPILSTIKLSFEETLFRTHKLDWVGLRNYFEVLNDGGWWLSVENTILFAAGSTVGHVLLGTWFALLLNVRWARPAIRNFVRGLLILPWLFSLAAASLIWSLIYQPTGPINDLLVGFGIASAPIDFLGNPSIALWALVLINIWKFYPFYMVMILGGLQSIPNEIYESARIDGAGSTRIFTAIVLPLLRPVLVTVTAIDMITTFTAFDLVRIMTGGGPLGATQTMAFYIWQTGFRDLNLGAGSAMSVAMLVTLGAATALYLRMVARRGAAHEAGADF